MIPFPFRGLLVRMIVYKALMIPFPFRGLLVRMIVYNKIHPKAYSNY